MSKAFNLARIYGTPQIIGIFLLGFSSGLPFLLTLSTLHAWLSEAGISKTAIGLFALPTVPYAFKFLWAPLIDCIRVPYLSYLLGPRRSWMLVSQLTLMVGLVGLGLTNPVHNIFITAFFVLFVSFGAASQDTVIEAYRIESLSLHLSSHAASASVLGFRLGMWVSGGVALYLAEVFNNWSVVYAIMSACMSIGVTATLLMPEPHTSYVFNRKLTLDREATFKLQPPYKNDFSVFFKKIFKISLTSFFAAKEWPLILGFIFFFKVGDTILNMMSVPFLLEIGFSKLEIAHIAKTFGIMAMISGGILGGMLLSSIHIVHNLILCSALQMISCIMFMLQAIIGHNVNFLMFTMGIENLACGISATVLVYYFSHLCQFPYTATHYALLSSFSSTSRLGLSILAGWLADLLTWTNFYAFVTIACIPCLVILIRYPGHFIFLRQNESQPKEEEKEKIIAA